MKGTSWLDDPRLKQAQRSARDVLSRSLDRNVRLAITGLSRSGKTAFITSLINQLLEGSDANQLPFFSVVREGRLLGVQRQLQPHLHVPAFRYEAAMDSLCGEQPEWPEPTDGISELRLALRYRPQSFWASKLGEQATLYLDITDYPGEWLLDLPMLEQSFYQWSQQMSQMLHSEPRYSVAQHWLARLAALDPLAPVSDQQIESLAEEYTDLLHHFRQQLGLYLIQPGRFILPGALAGAPVLHFFPLISPAGAEQPLSEAELQQAPADSLYARLKDRFDHYREHVVKGFYRDHFSRFDRQVVLADSLQALNHGAENFRDLRQALGLILQSYHYGRSNLLRRLFSPRIDRLLFIASKADHVTHDQHPALEELLRQLVREPQQQLNFEGIEHQVLATAAIRATEAGVTEWQQQRLPSLRGRDLASGQMRVIFPGDVPEQLPADSFWQQQGFKFVPFAPAGYSPERPLPHIRMDRVLEYLLGDKLQ